MTVTVAEIRKSVYPDLAGELRNGNAEIAGFAQGEDSRRLFGDQQVFRERPLLVHPLRFAVKAGMAGDLEHFL